MKNDIALSSMALDLKRAAVGFYRGSLSMGNRFALESLKRKEEINMDDLKSYIKDVLDKTEKTLMEKDNKNKAERLLMYSTIIQNFVISRKYSEV